MTVMSRAERRGRSWRPALEACEFDPELVPYEPCHSCASLLIHAGRDTRELRQQAQRRAGLERLIEGAAIGDHRVPAVDRGELLKPQVRARLRSRTRAVP